jgi:hypothetical protein
VHAGAGLLGVRLHLGGGVAERRRRHERISVHGTSRLHGGHQPQLRQRYPGHRQLYSGFGRFPHPRSSGTTHLPKPNGATMAESLLDIDRHVGQHRRPLRRLRKIRTPALEHSRRPYQRFRIDLDEEKQRQRRRQERHTHKTIKTTPCPTTIGQNTVQSPVLIEINSIVRMPTPPRLVIGPCFCLVPRPLRKQVGFDG